MPFWPICCESDAILFKKSRPGDRAVVFIWENFHSGSRDIGRKNRDLGNRASPASHMRHIDIFTKKRVAMRDLGNRASPVDWANMKRSLIIYGLQPHEPSFVRTRVKVERLDCSYCFYTTGA